ncbi:hypothetical protein PMIN06_007612 [Paraphaeosphaeria minitans]
MESLQSLEYLRGASAFEDRLPSLGTSDPSKDMLDTHVTWLVRVALLRVCLGFPGKVYMPGYELHND